MEHIQYRLFGILTVFIFGLLIFFTEGFGNALIRGYFGDVFIILFLYLVAGFFTGNAYKKGIAIFSFAVVVEYAQLFISFYSGWGALTMGSTFDVLDLYVYLGTVLFCIFIERSYEKE